MVRPADAAPLSLASACHAQSLHVIITQQVDNGNAVLVRVSAVRT
jgi:hypothetical protein